MLFSYLPMRLEHTHTPSKVKVRTFQVLIAFNYLWGLYLYVFFLNIKKYYDSLDAITSKVLVTINKFAINKECRWAPPPDTHIPGFSQQLQKQGKMQ